jgi:heterodisulfide reductase subunit C
VQQDLKGEKMMIRMVLEESKAFFCVDCGKCTAVCPMAEMYPEFSQEMSPRGIIRQALLSDNILQNDCLWYCPGCHAGTRICPEGVSCRDLVAGLRKLAMEKYPESQALVCTRCGALVTTRPVLGYIHNHLGEKQNTISCLCPFCKRQVYMERNTI